MVLILYTIALASVLFAVIYYHYSQLKKKFTYWKKRHVTQLEPDILYGDVKEQEQIKISSAEMYRDIYYKFKKLGVQHGGFYIVNRPAWMVVDPTIIKLVLVKDFTHFTAHNIKYGNQLFLNNLFHMDGEEWKDMRRKLTPTFTSGKMKMMFGIMLDKTTGLVELVGKLSRSGETAEMKQLLARFTTDVISSIGFGLEANSINDKNSDFYQNGQNMFKKLVRTKSVSPLTLLLPQLNSKKHIMFDVSKEEDYFRNVVNETVKYREENKISRKDFLHLMIQLKNMGTITDLVDEKEIFQKTGVKDGLSMEEVAQQCLLFIVAGFETTSATMSFGLLELSQNQDVQAKLRKEIRDTLAKTDGKLTYESLLDMTYLDGVIKETLRKYPPVPNLPRLCTKSYQIPGTDIVIEKGTNVQIPLFAIQNDPEYFPEPERFLPERFSPENKGNIVDFTYMPFGEGPRQCLGLRFGNMNAKIGLATLINHYNFTPNSKTKYPPTFDQGNPMFAVKGGIWLDVEEVK